MDCSPSGSSVHEILQARTLEWIAISLSRTQVWKWKSLDHVWLWPHGYSSWNSLSQNTGVGSLSLLQGSSQPRDWTQVIPHYQLSHQESSRILEWVTYPSCSRSFQPRNWTGVSYIADGFFTNWAITEIWTHVYLWPIHVDIWQKTS